MINYPKNYAPLAEEEMEYTSGGLSINWMALGSTVMGLATSMLAYLNVSNIAGVAVQLQKKDPEKYPEPEGTINGNLIIDSTDLFLQRGRHRHGPAEHRCGRGHRLSGHEVRFLKISTGHLSQNVV